MYPLQKRAGRDVSLFFSPPLLTGSADIKRSRTLNNIIIGQYYLSVSAISVNIISEPALRDSPSFIPYIASNPPN